MQEGDWVTEKSLRPTQTDLGCGDIAQTGRCTMGALLVHLFHVVYS